MFLTAKRRGSEQEGVSARANVSYVVGLRDVHLEVMVLALLQEEQRRVVFLHGHQYPTPNQTNQTRMRTKIEAS